MNCKMTLSQHDIFPLFRTPWMFLANLRERSVRISEHINNGDGQIIQPESLP